MASPPRSWGVKRGEWQCVLQEHAKAKEHQFRRQGETRNGGDQ